MKQFNVITLFPNMISAYLSEGIMSQAVRKQLISIDLINPREFTQDLHRTVDDTPYGGGDGMLMMAEPLVKSIKSIENPGKVVALSAHGETWNFKKAHAWAESSEPITFICGRYAGVDQRVINNYVDEQISVGDFILSGGELPALLVLDSVARFIPGVLGNKLSAFEESFQKQGMLECPQFTKPYEVLGQQVPDVLRSGHHKKIEEFQQMISVYITNKDRPDLIKAFKVSPDLIKTSEDYVKNLPMSERESLGIK